MTARLSAANPLAEKLLASLGIDARCGVHFVWARVDMERLQIRFPEKATREASRHEVGTLDTSLCE